MADRHDAPESTARPRAATPSRRSQLAELLIHCARIDFTP